jgi:hypothetical protein
MDANRVEELGFLAHKEGFFAQWQDTASRYLKEEEHQDKTLAYEKAYEKYSQVVGSEQLSS